MNQKTQTVKSACTADAIGPINYPLCFEKAAIPTGAAFTIIATVTMITGSVSKAISLSIVAALLVCALYALFRLWPAITGWFATHPRISTAMHFCIVMVGFIVGLGLIGFGGE